MPRSIPLLALAAVVLALVAAFAPGPVSARRVGGTTLLTPQPVAGGIYRAPLGSDVPTFDPALAGDTTSLTCILQMYDGLVRFHEGGMKVAPALAESWTLSEDGLTYTFKLRPGVRFHPRPAIRTALGPDLGREVTAADVKYSFERVLWPEIESPAATTFAPIRGSDDVIRGRRRDLEGIRVLDPRTVEIELEAPFAPFLASLTMPNAFVVQKEAVELEKAGIEKGLGLSRRPGPVGTGPFFLSDHVPGVRIELSANREYWDQPESGPRRPHLEGVVFVIEGDEDRRFRMFEAEELNHTDVPDPEYERVSSDPNFHSINQLGTYYLGFQCQAPPFSDHRIRRAFSHAVDKEFIVKQIRARRVVRARGPLPPNMPGYNEMLEERRYPLETWEYDPSAAERLLDEAGFPRDPVTGVRTGFPAVALDIHSEESDLRVARSVQANLMDVGIKIGIQRRSWPEHLKAVREGKSLFHRLGWVADYLDPDSFLFYNFYSGNIGSSNGNYYQNPQVDELLLEARRINNPSRRLKLYAKAEAAIARDAPWVCLYYYQSALLKRSDVQGLNLTALGTHMIRYDGVWLETRPGSTPPTR